MMKGGGFMESKSGTIPIPEKLIDCPFCGNAAILERKARVTKIACRNCPAEMSVPNSSSLSAQALWNSRACDCFGQNALDHPEDWGLPAKNIR